MHLPSEIPSGRSEVHRIRDRKSDAAQLHAAATELREKHLIEEKLTRLRRKCKNSCSKTMYYRYDCICHAALVQNRAESLAD